MTRFSYLASPSATREVVDRFGLGLKKSLGQNFLINDDIIGKIIDLAEVAAYDRVLEVGPGIGTLTAALLSAGAEVVSIERDVRLYDVLSETLARFKGFHLIEKDALDVSEEDISCALNSEAAGLLECGALVFPDKLVANLPYAVAATIILDYFQRFDFLKSATVMVQKEAADRICAKPGNKNYGAYTVKLSLYASATGGFPVSPGNFMPPPHVDSMVVRLDRSVSVMESGEAASSESIAAACMMADAAFYQRRKTIANSMKAYYSEKPRVRETIPEILSLAGIDAKRRGETLDQREFLKLGEQYLALSSEL